MLKVFGFEHPFLEAVSAPDRGWCQHCEEPILVDEPGFSLIQIDEESNARRVYYHRECFLRGIFGSVAHIERRCSCFVPGSTCTDDEDVTPREAARRSVKAFQEQDERLPKWRST